MEDAGGIMFLRGVAEVTDVFIQRDIEALRAEIDDLRAEYTNATKETKRKLQANIDTAKAKLKATEDRANAEVEAARRRTQAKVRSLQQQAAKARGDVKNKFDARLLQMEADYKQRSEELQKAWQLTKEALAV